MFIPKTLAHALLMLGCLLLFLIKSAHADVWGYLDDKGVPHFAAERVDERYELFFRSSVASLPAGDERAAVAALNEEFPRPVGVPRLPPKLLAFFEVSPSYKGVRHLIRDASDTYNIDLELLQALIATESGFDSAVVSPRGAVGLMQIMPSTAERYGVMADPKTPVEKKLTDPQTNIKTGSRYLRYLINLFPGRLELALAAYNAGEGAVQRAGNAIPRFKETQDYVKTVLQLYAMLKPPAAVADLRRTYSASPTRQRSGLPGLAAGAVVAGGAVGRANMISPLVALDTPSARSAELNFEP